MARAWGPEQHTEDQPDGEVARLTRLVRQQRSTIGAGERTGGGGAAERLLRSVIDSLDARMCILAQDGTILGTNRLWDELVSSGGWDREAASTGGDFFVATSKLAHEFADRIAEAARAILTQERAEASVKGRWLRGDTEEHAVVRVHPVRDHGVAKAVVTCVDITEGMRTQEALRRATDQAQLLALVAKHTDNSVAITDAEGMIEWVNDSFARLTGYAGGEVQGMRRSDLWRGDYTDSEGFARLLGDLQSGTPIDVEFPTESKSGKTYWVHVQAQPIVENGETVRWVCVERDVTLRRLSEEQLREASQRAESLASELSSEKSLLSGVLASIPHLVYWKDSHLRYSGVNQAFLAMRGLDGGDEVIGRTEAELSIRDELSDLLTAVEQRVLETGVPMTESRVSVAGSTGRRRNVLISVLPHSQEAGLIGVVADVTHVGELERQLAQASRLESIGQLAAGIAHEINTPMQYVSDNTQYVAETVDEVLTALRAVKLAAQLETATPDDAVRLRDRLLEVLDGIDLDVLAEDIPQALSQAQEGLSRVTQIVRAMKDFSHPGQGLMETDVNRAVRSTVQVSRNEWRYVAEVELDLDDEVGTVMAYEGELKQVVLNIIVNAAQAIGEAAESSGSNGIGHIKVSTRRLGERIQIIISDDGPGMDEATQLRIFDPFFTTKEVGKGTGQGLSLAYATIVQKHQGTLEVRSAPGAGATFTIGFADTVALPIS